MARSHGHDDVDRFERQEDAKTAVYDSLSAPTPLPLPNGGEGSGGGRSLPIRRNRERLEGLPHLLAGDRVVGQ